MKRHAVRQVALGLAMAALGAAAAGRALRAQTIRLDGTWRSRIAGQDAGPVNVPFSVPPRDGVATYTRTFALPPGTRTGLVRLCFDGVVGRATVELNGFPLGRHGSYTPFWFDVTGLVRTTEENELSVTIDDRLDVTTVPYDEIPWVNYSGLIRPVRLECADRVAILSLEPQYVLAEDHSRVEGNVRVRLAGQAGTRVALEGAILDGSPDSWVPAAMLAPVSVTIHAGRSGEGDLHFVLETPALWSPEAPRLYHLYVVASVEGRPEAEALVRTGFRDIRVRDNDILLNGRPVLLKGISRHDMYPGTGFVGAEQQMAEDMLAIKATGANYVRLIHYPHHPRILELADEIGLMVSEEVPAWANFWDPLVREELYGMIREMVQRDMLHPSVILWISGNARAHPMPYAAEAQALFKSLDRNRLASYVIDNDEYDPATIDADASFVRQAGLDLYMKITWWFYYLEYLQDAWTNFPKDMPILIAEFGREGSDRGPLVITDGREYRWGGDKQAGAVTEMLEGWRPHLPAYAREHIAGLCLFNYQDTAWPGIGRYLPGHVPGIHWGIVYEDRVPKQLFGRIAEFYSRLPDTFVGLPTPQDAHVLRLFGRPETMGALNGPQREAAPSVATGGRMLVFASDGPDYVGRLRLFVSALEDGAWTRPAPLSLPTESDPDAYRTGPCLAADGRKLLFARGRIDGIYVTDLRIWQCVQVEGTWSVPEDLGDTVNWPDPATTTTDPDLSPDGERLYFASDRPGGLGRLDLWMARRDAGGWQAPINLGPPVNTPYEESGPCVSADGRTLYFSSDRPGGMGSSDIWVSRWIDGGWSEPRNLGPELNSSGAEKDPCVTRDEQVLFFTGIRSGGQGLSDLWCAGSLFSLGDTDRDGDVDLADFARFQACYGGPGRPMLLDCAELDFDHDGHVDVTDFTIFQMCFNGAGRTPSPLCPS